MVDSGNSCSGFVDMNDSKDRKLGTWQMYGLLGVLIVIYSTNLVVKSKPEYVKKLWIAYILLAALLGFMGY
tara:strand:- start:1330 stop:1542 length:213 start_codon:yes stop_codon:yes gene_type:complete